MRRKKIAHPTNSKSTPKDTTMTVKKGSSMIIKLVKSSFLTYCLYNFEWLNDHTIIYYISKKKKRET